jgi:hypothetical protein
VIAFLPTCLFVFTNGIRGSAWVAIIKDIMMLLSVGIVGFGVPFIYFGGIGDMFHTLAVQRPAHLIFPGATANKEHKAAFDFSKMIEYAKAYNLTIQRNLGFLLDAVGVSTDALREITRKNMTGFSRMHGNAKTFNAKWRLYYDPGVIK